MDQSSSSTANSYADYQAMVIQVSTALEALESLCGDLSLEENRRELEKCRKKLLDHTFTVGVMGEFKRGKSTVINALLGKELMPADILHEPGHFWAESPGGTADAGWLLSADPGGSPF